MFISSVNSEPECNRAAAADAVRSLGHEAVLAEEFSASPDSPRRVCLAAARSADLVLLLMGAKYGAAQERGVSPTHEEYREAREHTPVLVFEQEGCQREPNQEAFYQEVRGWERGHVFNSFSGADTLRNAVTRAIHEHALRSEAGDVSPGDLIERATAVIPQRPRSEPGILVAVAGGPHQQLVRPAALEDARLRREFLAECLTGENAVLDPSSGTDTLVEDGSLLARAREGVGWVRLAEDGTIGISQDGIKNPRDGGFLLALDSL